MPEHKTVTFDASASSSEPYYQMNAIVEHDGNRLWRVLSVKSRGGTRREAMLEAIDYPTEDEYAQAVSWRWTGDRMSWVPSKRTS